MSLMRHYSKKEKENEFRKNKKSRYKVFRKRNYI